MEAEGDADGSWQVLAQSQDALRLVVQTLNGADKRSFRATCTAARNAVDVSITLIRLECGDISPPLDHVDADEGDNIVDEGEKVEEVIPQDGVTENLCEEWEEPLQLAELLPISCGHWPAVESVCISGCHCSERIEQVIDSGRDLWGGVRELRFIGCLLGGEEEGPETLCALVAQPWSSLIELELSECGLDEESLEILSELEADQLEDLDLSGSAFTNLEELQAAYWPCLQALSLGGSPNLHVPQALAFASDKFSELTDIDLSGTPLDRAAMQALTSLSPLAGRLKWLRLAECGLTDEFLTPLTSASWPQLQLLDLSKNGLTSAAAIQAIVQAKLPSLWSLDLSGNCNLQPFAFEALASADWPCLEWFSAREMALGSRGAAGLVAANLPRLTVLDLYECVMPWAAVDRLATGRWERLRRLNLGGNGYGVQVRRAGPSLVVASWDNLRTLVLRATRLTSTRAKTAIRKEMHQLRERWPDLRITYE